MESRIFAASSVILAGSALVSFSQKSTEQEKPNILFIMSDDHAYQAISAYGYNLIETTNIDRIAKEGAIFNQSFVTNSICAPSRAVMLTGKYSHLNGKIDNEGGFDWDQENVAKILQRSGYQTALIGKIHLDGLPQGFDYSMVLPGQGSYYNPEFLENGEKKVFEGHCTPLTTEFALDWLESKRDKSKPFFLIYNQKAPHRNWMPETKYLDYFEDREFDFPKNFFDTYEGRGSAAKEQKMEILRDMRWGNDMKFEKDKDPLTNIAINDPKNQFKNEIDRMNDSQREAWRAAYNPRNEAFINSNPDFLAVAKFKYHRYLRDYLKCVKSVDDGVGEVLDYLKANGLDKNTIVIYTSDQGFYLGEHGWFDKRFMYEESFRMPLLVRYPKEIKPGSVIDKMVMNLDFAPTFLDYAGVDVPDEMQGESFRKVVAGKDVKWRDAVYYHYYEYPGSHSVKRHEGVRTKRYKLIHFYFDIDEWELYDLEKDPSEMNSVYNNADYKEVQEMLSKKLTELRAKYSVSDELQQKIY